ncbi:unnamed protein product [Medioppia subpectinata]|uniref:Uncharacterized protein n=1 Tax=Medioppia subpectinata TaxID=1979941 RepID=A0A7R9PY96_9ACAR|nr:unnamed protein product [Medioppia subpectinata]CAG2105166.1 unnamed protein product [Medioppia subpectinata]
MASSLSAMAYALGGCILPIVVYITGHWVLLAVFQFAITIPIIIFWRIRLLAHNTEKKVGEECERKTNSCGRKDSVYDLVRIPELLKQTLILTLLIVANVVAYYGLYLNALNFHGNELTNSFLLSLVDLPALCLGWYLIEGRLGRRWTNTISLMFCGISLCVPAFVDPSQTTIITIMSLLGKMGTAVSYMVIYQQSAEVFPTTLRSEGMGICSTAGSAVSIIVPQIAYLESPDIVHIPQPPRVRPQ